ncbi:hypothetical protein K502DRAFT_363501 [Neoconidiobolus thromboides FSU 785]|nr:hypothetical protein K502DRAFT_363501 [Neoconidiobolus thromboides FSU 785]
MAQANAIELSTTNNNEPWLGDTNIRINHLKKFHLELHYTLKRNLNQVCYKVMMYGDIHLKKELKAVIIRTYIFRIILTLPLISGVLFGFSYIFLDQKLYQYYSLVIILGLSIFIGVQLLDRRLRSIRDTETFLRVNKRLIPRLEANERASYELELQRIMHLPDVERVDYVPKPPNYDQIDNSPPGY